MAHSAIQESYDPAFSEQGVLTPGCLVRHPECPEWGVGQVQSSIGDRLTVNFENNGKTLINTLRVVLEPVSLEEACAPL